MKKKTIMIMGMAALMGATAISGCSKKNEASDVSASSEADTDSVLNIDSDNESDSENQDGTDADGTDDSQTNESAGTSNNSKTAAVDSASSAIYEKISKCSFEFSSGAGAWSTELTVNKDGSFKGLYHDSDAGSTGTGYPNGTVYVSEFSGIFGNLQKVDDYTYKTTIQNITTAKKAGTEELADDMKYVYTTPYGLDDAKTIYIYLKGKPVSSLPEGYKDWGVMILDDNVKTLPCYGIYNENAENGFYGWTDEDYNEWSQSLGAGSADSTSVNQEAAALAEGLADTEKKAAAIEEKIAKEALTQTEYNEASAELYKLWDNQLNVTWKQLKKTLSDSEMSTLTKEEKEWIKEKEQKMKDAVKGFEGGSMEPMLRDDEGTALTRARVYELIEYLVK